MYSRLLRAVAVVVVCYVMLMITRMVLIDMFHLLLLSVFSLFEIIMANLQ